MNRSDSEIPENIGNSVAAILQFSVGPHDVQSVQELCLVVRVGHLHHGI